MMSDAVRGWVRIVIAILVFVIGAGFAIYIKFRLPSSDYQRMERVEARLDALEEGDRGH